MQHKNVRVFSSEAINHLVKITNKNLCPNSGKGPKRNLLGAFWLNALGLVTLPLPLGGELQATPKAASLAGLLLGTGDLVFV